MASGVLGHGSDENSACDICCVLGTGECCCSAGVGASGSPSGSSAALALSSPNLNVGLRAGTWRVQLHMPLVSTDVAKAFFAARTVPKSDVPASLLWSAAGQGDSCQGHTHGHTIRIAPPLVITSDQVEWTLEGIETTLRRDLS
jgi:hypothetical protein